MKNRNGQMLVGVLALLVVLLIVVPTMVRYVQNEAKWSVKQGQNTNAFQLAEAAVDRGYQKIAESTSTWQAIQDGTVLTGFNFDTVYSDITGGTYTISITSGPDSGDVTITTVGRDKMKRETRALKVVYSKATMDSAMYANGISIAGSVLVDWGSLKSRGSMNLTGSPPHYPRKYAIGSITGWNTISPCTDSIEFWAYNCSPGVPPPPAIALNSYRAIAKATKCPTGSGPRFPAGAVPAGSCYWNTDPGFSGIVMTSTGTIFVENDMTVTNGFIWGNLIVTGELEFKGGAGGIAYSIPTAGAPAPFTGGIPSLAWMEYQQFDTAAADEYYGDNGLKTVNATFSFSSSGATPAKHLGAKVTPSVRGFVYCGGELEAAGGTVFHGAIYSPIGVSGLSGAINVFYDNNVAAAVLTDTIYPTRTSWLDSKQAWPAALP